VDDFVAGHSVAALRELAAVIAGLGTRDPGAQPRSRRQPVPPLA
jgi:hypothetical protein